MINSYVLYCFEVIVIVSYSNNEIFGILELNLVLYVCIIFFRNKISLLMMKVKMGLL